MYATYSRSGAALRPTGIDWEVAFVVPFPITHRLLILGIISLRDWGHVILGGTNEEIQPPVNVTTVFGTERSRKHPREKRHYQKHLYLHQIVSLNYHTCRERPKLKQASTEDLRCRSNSRTTCLCPEVQPWHWQAVRRLLPNPSISVIKPNCISSKKDQLEFSVFNSNVLPVVALRQSRYR